MRAAGATGEALGSTRVYQIFFCEQLTSTALKIWKPCTCSSGCASMYCIQPSWLVLPVVASAGEGGVSVPPTVEPMVTIVAPAALRYCSADFSASVVPVVPNGSAHV